MANKGTQALLISDVSLMKNVLNGIVAFSVSTTDVKGVKRLNLPLDAVVPAVVDIPYEKADYRAKELGFTRDSYRYKVHTIALLIFMPIQMILSLISVLLVKLKMRTFYRAETLERIKNCSLVISCSDENFKESASMLPLNIYWLITWWSMLVSRTWEILIAKFLQKPVVVFPNSVGPFRTWIGRSLAKLALHLCDCILVREPISYELVKSWGLRTPMILTTDTTLFLDSNRDVSLEKSGNPVLGACLGVYDRSLPKKEFERYILAHANALDSTIEKHGFSVIFMPFYVSGFRSDDLEICRLVLGKMKYADRAKIVYMSDVEEFRASIKQMDMVISSRMHPAVFAVSAYVPTVNVAYDHKQTGFFMSLGMSDCVLSIREASCKELLSKIDNVFTNRDSIKSQLQIRIPQLQRQLKESIRLAVAPFIEKDGVHRS
jgi:colanic acid/amylovoran biosynthesis protein